MTKLQDYFQFKFNYKVSSHTSKSLWEVTYSVDLNQDGFKDVALFGFTFPETGVTAGTPQKSMFYWGSANGTYELASLSSIDIPATVHPREFVTADFNKDGKLDLFIADHGWDADPYPGGQNQLLLSSPNGWVNATSNLPQRLDFTHSTAVGDVNKDGYIDIFIGNSQTNSAPYSASVLFGQSDGRFRESPEVLPIEIRNSSGPTGICFTASLLSDLNNDGWVDLIIGNDGNDLNKKTQSIAYWNKNGAFNNENSTLIPNGFFGNKNEQILDIQAADLDGDGVKELVLLSTQTDPFYDGWSLQVLKLSGDNFIDVTSAAFGSSVSKMGLAGKLSKSPWIPFFKLTDVNADGTTDLLLEDLHMGNTAIDQATMPLIYLNDGYNHLSPILVSDVLDLGPKNKEFFNMASAYVDSKGVSWLVTFKYQESVYFIEVIPTMPLPKIATITATNGADKVIGNETNNSLFGLAGNDLLEGGLGNDLIDGGAGLDTVKVNDTMGLSNEQNYSLTKSNDGFWNVTFTGPTVAIYPPPTTNGSDTLINVERLKFNDKSFALDLDGNAGKAAKVIGAVLGSAFVSNPTFVGIGLDYLDKGMSYSDLGALALKAVGANTNDSIVSTLWRNVVGFEANPDQKAPYVKMLDEGMKAGDLVVMAGDLALNTIKINLTGLAQSGLEYLPVS